MGPFATDHDVTREDLALTLFAPENSTLSDRHRLHIRSSISETFVDFVAWIFFVIGSILFFYADTRYADTWCFLIGSIFFGLRPTIRASSQNRSRPI